MLHVETPKLWTPPKGIFVPKRRAMQDWGIRAGGRARPWFNNPTTHIFVDEAAVTITKTAAPTAQTTDATSFTFSSVAIGDEAADRIIIFGAASSMQTNDAEIATCTLDGNSMTAVIAEHATGSKKCAASLFALAWPTGTTAEFIMASSTGNIAHGLPVIWSMTGAASATPTDTAFSEATDPTTAALDVPANGGAVYIASSRAGSFTATPVGLDTEDRDEISETDSISAASENFSAAQTALSVGPDWSGSPTAGNPIMVAAAWGP